jgi:hypothetical protein
VVAGTNLQSERTAEHRKSEFADTQVPAETEERPGTWAAAGTAYTPAAPAALMEARVAATVAERPPRTALETAARVPLCWPPPGAEDGGGGRGGAVCCTGAAGTEGRAAGPYTPACSGRWPAIRTETKDHGGGLDDGVDDDGEEEELDDGGTEGAGVGDVESDARDEELGGDTIVGDEDLDDERTLGLC